MQAGGKCIVAEDSCFIKYHPQDGTNDPAARSPTADVPHDVEKASVKTPVAEAPVMVSATDAEKGEDRDSDGHHFKDDDKDDFPEGGVKAWSVVVGALCGSFAVFGILNSTGVLLEYFQANQLKDYTSSQIGWIFGLSLFLTFFCGAPVGPIFDSYGPKALIFSGSVLLVASMFLLGLCTQYWHFFLVYGVLNGIGGALINTPCIASVGHYFLRRRGNATGIAMTAGSIGGIIFPLMLQRLFPSVGFAWATRILGFILLGLLILANLLVRSRLPLKPMTSLRSVSPDLSVFKDLPFALTAMGIFLMEWGLFVPLTYVPSYATAQGHSSPFSFQILAVLNAGSFFGRLGAGLVADVMGRMNTLILSLVLCVISCLALWLPAASSSAVLVVFAVLFGFGSGSNLSLSPVCVGQMCRTENYGRYFATCWMFVAFGTLSSLPIAGQILAACDGEYWGLIVFAGLSYTAAALFLIAARVLVVGWKITAIY